MNAIIPVTDRTVGAEIIPTADARELHRFLEVGKDFSTWMKDRVAQYGFIEGRDFTTYEVVPAPQNRGAEGNRGVRIEYAITLDMAKELAMVERNEKGKEARQYFIECERRLKAGAFPVLSPATVDQIVAVAVPIATATVRALLAEQSERRADEMAVVAEGRRFKRAMVDLARARTPGGSAKRRSAERQVIDNEHRGDLGFFGAGAKWEAFPASRLEELKRRTESMRREIERLTKDQRPTLPLGGGEGAAR